MSKIETLEPEFRSKVLGVISTLQTMGIAAVCTSGRRTMAEQHTLYCQGRTTPGNIVTKADAGQSPHNFGLAADLCPLDEDGKLAWDASDDIWHVIADIAVQHGLVAGYYFKSFKDAPHMESPDWKQAQAEWKAGNLIVP
jgi:peptidoglycan L-alanyl-D-glutamate endopeptidase CwlK